MTGFRKICVSFALVACCLLHISSADLEKPDNAGTIVQQRRNDSSSVIRNASQGESEIMEAARNALPSNTGLVFDENYETLLSGESSTNIDIMNDSSEIEDALDGALVLPKDMSKPTSKMKQGYMFKNVYKVPKKSARSEMPQSQIYGQASLRSDRTINDFNLDTFIPSGNSSHSYFRVFSSLYDHYMWSSSSLTSVSGSCLNDLNLYFNDLRASVDWAVKANDASGHYRGLFFFDNDFWLGSKQCCYEINYENRNAQVPEMRFFVVKILVKLLPSASTPRLLHVGQCLPKTCSSQDITTLMKQDPSAIALNQMVTLTEADQSHTESKSNEVKVLETRTVPGEVNIWKDKKLFAFGSIILGIFMLIVIASIYENILATRGFNLGESGQFELLRQKSSLSNIKCSLKETERHEMNHINNNNNNNMNGEIDSEPDKVCEANERKKLGFGSKILLCFAYKSNASVILSTTTNSEDSLTCIHGLRLITLLWTIMVHTYLQMFGIGENRFIRKISERTFLYQMVGNATYSVDTFFFISGLLVVLLFLKSEKAKRPDSVGVESSRKDFWSSGLRKTFMMISYRFLRLTPVYIVIIVFTELALKVIYNDSVFSPALTDHVTCNQFWWRNILYINNFFPLTQICLMWSWYLANDFQFYVIAIALLILSRRFLKLSVISSALLLVASWVVTIYVSIHFKYIHKVADPFESFDILYDKPWQRFGPYAMGMITGYVLFRVKAPLKVPAIINLILWALSLSTLFIIVFGVPRGQLSVFMTSLYVSLGHTGWGLGLIWPTLSCSWKLAEPVNGFLSYNGFFPLSRLTYCTYLIHPTVMMITSFQCDGATHLKHGMILTAFFGNAVISFLAAFILSIMFEAPVIRLLKLFFR